MSLNLTRTRQPQELRPRIVVFGVGGAGCNAVNNMIRLNLEGVECAVANTDAQALSLCVAERKIQLGLSITQGLGAGSRPEIGRAAAEEAWDDISAHVQGAHMVFITAGMGGGTGTGAAPVVARAAREQGLLTVGVVTKPFHFEGAHRMRLAEAGLAELQEVVDTLIVIPNQNLFRVANEKTTFADAFHMADTVLYSGVRGITDLMVMPGLINLDFADIRTVMSEMGKAMMGSGEADGSNRAIEAAERAISNPLLDDTSMAGARGLLNSITGGRDLTLFEVDEASNRVRDEVDPQANIIFGSAFDEALEGRIRVSVFATGIEAQAAQKPKGEQARTATTMSRPTPVRMPIGAEPVQAAPAPTPAPAPAPMQRPAAAQAAPSPLRPAARAAAPAVAPAAAEFADAPVPRRAMEPRREVPAPRQPAIAHDYETVLPGAATPALTVDDVAHAPTQATIPAHASAAPPTVVMQQGAAATPAAEEQPDMFVAAEGRRPAAPERPLMDRPRAAQPAQRMEAPRAAAPQPQGDRGRMVAHVDDIEPEQSSPERTIRTGDASRQDPPSRTNRPSIFNLWRGRKTEEEATKRSEPVAPAAARVRPEPAAPTPLRAPQPAVEPAPRPAAAAPGPTIDTQQQRRGKDEDVLEIPAFLRRQAN